MDAPVLTTARLVLRAHVRDDFEDLHAMWSDAEVTRHIGGKPSTRQDSWMRLMRYHGGWALQGFGYWAALDSLTGAYLGDVGLHDLKRGLDPGFDDTPEAGWAFGPSAWGRGIATEAMRAVLEWADTGLCAPRTVCMIAPGNPASIAVAGKLGYAPFRDAESGGAPVTLFERVRG